MTGDTPAHTTEEAWCQNNTPPFPVFEAGMINWVVDAETGQNGLGALRKHFELLYEDREKGSQKLGEFCCRSGTKGRCPQFSRLGLGITLRDYLNAKGYSVGQPVFVS